MTSPQSHPPPQRKPQPVTFWLKLMVPPSYSKPTQVLQGGRSELEWTGTNKEGDAQGDAQRVGFEQWSSSDQQTHSSGCWIRRKSRDKAGNTRF